MREPDVHLNLNVRGMGLSPTVAINELSDRLRKEGREIFKLGLGQSPFPVPEPLVAALRANAAEKAYLPVRGLQALRASVAAHHQRRHDVPAHADDVLIGPGSKELMFLLQLVYYGDLVIPAPAWVSYAPQAQAVGRRVCILQTRAEDDWRLRPDQLDALCKSDPDRPRVIIVNYPSNPTGMTYTPEELEQLAEAARRYRMIVLSDEIYGELHHDGRHTSIARYYPEGTIISSGLSKWCGAGGWRLGTFLFPPRLRWLLDGMAAVASETFTSTSAPIQYAAITGFDGGPEIEAYLSTARKILKALAAELVTRLNRGDITVPVPEGGFYLFPDFSKHRARLHAAGITTSDALCERVLAETGVAMLPGSAFGRPPEELAARIAYVDFDGALALKAAETSPIDAAFVAAHAPNVLTAVDRMVAWARG